MTWSPQEPTAEQLREYELAQMRQQEMFLRWRRYFVDMPLEDLEMLLLLVSTIGNSSSPLSMAKLYEGMIIGAKWVRELRLGEGTEEDEVVG